MVCKKWELKFIMKKVKEARDLARFVAREFSNLEYLMLIVDKLKLLKENPVKYSREKLGKDVYGNPVFSLKVIWIYKDTLQRGLKKLYSFHLGDWVSQGRLRSGLSS